METSPRTELIKLIFDYTIILNLLYVFNFTRYVTINSLSITQQFKVTMFESKLK